MAKDFSIELGLVGTAQVVTGLQSLINLAGQVATKVAEIARETQAYSRVVRAHTVSVTEADNATDGLIDTMELHRSAARIETAQLEVSSRQMRGLAVAARELARRTGEDATQAFRSLTDSIINGNDRGLRPLGIRLDDVRDRAQRGQVALERLTASFGDQTSQAQGLADEIYRLENAWGTAWAEMALTAEQEGGAIIAILRGVTDVINDVANALATQRESRAHMARMGSELRLREIEEEVAALGYSMRTGERREGARYELSRWVQMGAGAVSAAGRGEIGEAAVGLGRFVGTAFGLRPVGELAGGTARAQEEQRVRDLIAEYERLQAEDIRAIREGRQHPTGRTSVMEFGGVSGEERRRGGGRAPEGEEPLVAAAARQEQLTTDLIEGARQAWEQVFSDIERYASETEANADFYNEILQTQADIEAQLADQTATAVEEANERKVVSIEEYLARQEKELRGYEETTSKLRATGEVLGGVGKLFGEMGDIAEMAAGKQSAATKALAAIEGAFLVGYNIAMGATETAEAVSSFASQDYVGGALHVVAAALYFVAAAKSAVELGVSSRSGASSGGAGASSATPERDRGGRGRRETQPTVITINNGVVTSNRVEEDLRYASADASRQRSAA